MTLQQGRPARSSASYLFPLRGRNSPPPIPSGFWPKWDRGRKVFPAMAHSCMSCAQSRERGCTRDGAVTVCVGVVCK